MAAYCSSGSGDALGSSSPNAEDTDSYTPSAGVAESVKGMLGLKGDEAHHVLPILLEEIFGECGAKGQEFIEGRVSN